MELIAGICSPLAQEQLAILSGYWLTGLGGMT